MSIFTDAEIEYLQHRATRWSESKALLERLATVGPDGRPHVVPLGVTYDPEAKAIVISGHAGTNMAASKKFRDAQRNPDVAVVIDDLESVDPWTPRFIEIRGRAETFTEGGEDQGRRLADPLPWDPAWIRVRARRIVTLGSSAPTSSPRVTWARTRSGGQPSASRWPVLVETGDRVSCIPHADAVVAHRWWSPGA